MANVSTDMSEFVRKDVYEADQRALLAEIRLGNAEILKRIERLEIEIDGKILKVNARIDNVETKIDAMNTRIDDMNTRLGETHSVMGWGIGIMAAVIAFLLVISPVATFMKNLFRPPITLEQIDELITKKIDTIIAARLGVK